MSDSEWKARVIDQLVAMHILTPEHETNPVKAINDMLYWTHDAALDPAVSSEAAELHHRIQSLESQLAESRAENSAEVERLRAFRVAVMGWRTHNHPEWFCRRTAEMVADYGRAGEGRAIQGGGK